MALNYLIHGGEIPLPVSVRTAIIKAFWPATHYELESFDTFFRYLEYVLRQLNDYPWLQSGSLAINSMADIFVVVGALREKRKTSRKDLVEHLKVTHFPQASTEQIALSMDLCAHLAFSLNVHAAKCHLPFIDSGSSFVDWEEDMCLDEIAGNCFPSLHLEQTAHAPIDPQLTTANLFRFAAIRVKWTSNLSDHLHLDVLHRTVYIYAHKACLLAHFENPDSILPSHIIQATLLTMDLLFPYGDPKTQRFLAHHKQPLHRIYSPAFTAPSTLEGFGVWEERLVELYAAYNAPRVGYRQFSYDERNPMQWWTFWLAWIIAILTIVFGSISTVTSLEQTKLARLSYELARSQSAGELGH